MGRIDPAPPPPGRGPGSAAGWIVAAALAIALAALLAFEFGKRSRVDRETPAAVTSAPLATAAPAPVFSPIFAAPTIPQEGRVEHAIMEVTIAPPRTLSPTALSCLDQAAALLPILEPLIVDFKQEAEIALSTPRLSVASEISRLQEIYNKTMRLDDWPAPSCGYVLQSAVGHAEGFDIARLKAFLGGSNFSLTEAAKKHWDYADVQLRLMQDRVRSGRN